MKKFLDRIPLSPNQSKGEEIANSITHGIGVVVSIAALVILVVFSSLQGDAWKIVSFSIYGATMITLFLASTLYHSFTNIYVKKFFRIIDHSSIFLLIAGTYTPLLLLPMRGAWGWSIFGVVWGLTLFGIIFEIFFMGRFKAVTLSLYIMMGWIIVVAIKPMLNTVPKSLLYYISAGGLFYTFGIIFYVNKKLKYHHSIWHLFVLGGAISHFLGIYFYLL
ncbi:MAG: hemolysin III family protein [Candidatus Cloacimonadota bacterium]|nr:hemolysin III family protein [Candidatus Cloacimonadota bacterium]